MTTAFRSVLLFSLLCFLTLGVAWGQDPGNLPNPADSQFSQDFDFDSVNLQTLSVELHVPVISKPGAIPFSYTLIGNSSCQPTTFSGHSYAECGIGLTKLYIATDYNLNLRGSTQPQQWYIVGTVATGTCAADSNSFTKTFTQMHLVGPDSSTYYINPSDSFVLESGGSSCAVTLDTYTLQEGIHVVSDPTVWSTQPTVKATTPSGLVYPATGLKKVSDPFTNSITLGSTNVITDTLNNSTFSITSPGSGETDTYKDTGSTPQSVTSVLSGSYTVKTAFGCGTLPNDTSYTSPLLTEMDFPDGNNMYFQYEPVTGGVTGRLKQMTLRTGGNVSYTYGAKVNCAALMPSSLTRTTADGTTTYSLSLFTSGAYHGSTTTVLDPGKNKTVYTFMGTDANGAASLWVPLTLTEVQIYQNTGTLASPINTLLSTTIYCYNTNATNCPTTQASYPITEKDTYTAPGSKTTYSRVKQLFDSYGNVTSVSRYSAFVAIGAGTADNTTTITYGSWNGSSCVAVGSGIVNKPCDVKTTDSASHTLAESRYNYNVYGFQLYAQNWTGSTWLTSSANPNGNGTPNNTTSPTGQVTYHGHALTGSGGCNAILPTGDYTTLGTATIGTAFTWDCNMGKLLTSTDVNSNQSTFTYDLLGRPSSQADPLTYTLSESYPSATSSKLTDSTYFTTTLTVDGLGRPILSQRTDGATYDTVSTAYAFTAGTNPQWQVSTSQPCITTLGADCTKNHFGIMDPLGRSISSSTTSNETVASAFNQNDASTTLSPAPSGENNKTVQTEYDGMGRVISTCALQTTGGTACGQVDGNSGILTSYAYSYNYTGTMNVLVTRGSQTHQLIYDTLGRLVFQTLPESGSTTYHWDTSSATCGNLSEPGSLTETIDANGTYVCYLTDALGRMTTSFIPVGGVWTQCRDFIYGDQNAGAPMANSTNRVAEAVLDISCVGGHDVDEYFAYDKVGRNTDVYETTPHSGGQYHTQASYALNGTLASVSGVPGILTYTVTLDSNGRPDSSKYGTNVVGSNVVYNGAGQPTEIDYQGADKDLFPRDPNTGLMTGWTFTVGSASETAVLTWNPNRTLKKLAITDGFNSGGTQTCHYNPTDAAGSGYDDVGRLVGVNCGTPWTQTYSYDQYNNFSKSGTFNWNPGYNSTVTCPTGTVCNHITGGGYDSDGQVTYDLNNSYAWDGYHKMTTANSGSSLGSCGSAGVTCVTYDALGRPVEKNIGGTITELLYSPIGLTGIMSGQTANHFRVPIPGGSQIDFTPSGGWNISHVDWLGSARIISGLTGHTATTDQAYSPYGETYASFGTTGRLNFTGDFQDLYSGLYDTPNREFDTSSGSRWLTPDPARASWNAYSYPVNPNSMIDPSGLDAISTVQHKQLGFGDLERYDTLSSFSNPYDPTNPSSSESMFLSGVSIAPLAGGTSSASGMSVVYKFSGEPGGAVFQTTSFGNPVNYYDVFTGTNLGNGFVKPAIHFTPLGKPGVARPKRNRPQKQKKGHYLLFQGFNLFTFQDFTKFPETWEVTVGEECITSVCLTGSNAGVIETDVLVEGEAGLATTGAAGGLAATGAAALVAIPIAVAIENSWLAQYNTNVGEQLNQFMDNVFGHDQ